MTLEQWLARQGYGAAHRLMFRAGVSHPVIVRARKGRATLASALKIYRATGGKVALSSMTPEAVDDVSVSVGPARKRARR